MNKRLLSGAAYRGTKASGKNITKYDGSTDAYVK